MTTPNPNPYQPYQQQPNLNGYQQQPDQPYTPAPAPAPEPTYNGLAIAGFVCAFLLPILSIFFCPIALSQIKKTGQKGKGLAIAGLIITIVALIIGIIEVVAIGATVFGAYSYSAALSL